MSKQVIVIGGGAAGAMAAFMAAKNGHKVTLFEKNEKIGKKIFITGKGRCNVTNACDITDFFENIMKFFVAIFSSFIPVITTPILIIYFIIYYEKIEEWIKNKTINNSWLFNILKEIKESMQLYFKSYLLITLVLSFFSSIAFALLKIEYFLIWGIIIGITNIIPYIGPYIGGGIVGLYVLTTTPDLLLYVIIIIVCLQVIESNFLTPKIQGDTLKINPILVVFSITFFGKILGIIGMIIAVPVVQIIQIVVNGKKLLKKR